MIIVSSVICNQLICTAHAHLTKKMFAAPVGQPSADCPIPLGNTNIIIVNGIVRDTVKEITKLSKPKKDGGIDLENVG